MTDTLDRHNAIHEVTTAARKALIEAIGQGWDVSQSTGAEWADYERMGGEWTEQLELLANVAPDGEAPDEWADAKLNEILEEVYVDGEVIDSDTNEPLDGRPEIA